jgi:hypothetical protein
MAAASTLTGWPRRLTAFAFYLAIGAAILLAVAGPGYRAGLLPLPTALLGTVAAFLIFAIAFAFAVVGLSWARLRGQAGLARGIVTAVVAGAATVYMLVWIPQLRAAPPIHEISTDLEEPPEFVAVVPLRRVAGAANPPEYVRERDFGAQTIDVPMAQRSAYPDIETLVLEAPVERVFAAAEQVARDRGWEIVAVEPAAGRIEATATTFYFGFEDDVVVRVRPGANGTEVDVRSKSRIGGGDAGTNAARVRDYLAGLGAATI